MDKAERPREREKARYAAAVCLETGAVLAMPLGGKRGAETTARLLAALPHHPADRGRSRDRRCFAFPTTRVTGDGDLFWRSLEVS